jgi:hypothetical protein
MLPFNPWSLTGLMNHLEMECLILTLFKDYLALNIGRYES